jgi:curli biogenesis system outer membrane secretion channel CsgG
MNMKTLVALVALSAAVAGPAFAQAPTRNHAFHQQSSSTVHPYAADVPYVARGYEYNNDANPDFQLGGGER